MGFRVEGFGFRVCQGRSGGKGQDRLKLPRSRNEGSELAPCVSVEAFTQERAPDQWSDLNPWAHPAGEC